MKTQIELSNHERRLLRDFLCRRPKYLTTVNALISAIAIVCLLWLFSDSFTQITVASLSGALIGVYFEQRHINELRTVFKKTSRDLLDVESESIAGT